MADIKTSTQRMKTDVENISGYVNRIEKKYGTLLRKVAELNDMWDGSASDTFQATYKDDLLALQIMISNLKKIYSYEDSAKQRYELCENQIAEVISDI